MQLLSLVIGASNYVMELSQVERVVGLDSNFAEGYRLTGSPTHVVVKGQLKQLHCLGVMLGGRPSILRRGSRIILPARYGDLALLCELVLDVFDASGLRQEGELLFTPQGQVYRFLPLERIVADIRRTTPYVGL